MSLFDSYQASSQKIVEALYADIATWTPKANYSFSPLVSHSASVLYNEPTKDEKVADQNYTVQRPSIEFFEGSLPGLLELVLDSQMEVITVKGRAYYGMDGERLFDGKTIKIYLELKK